jgi:AcrR family transcriptional regulator
MGARAVAAEETRSRIVGATVALFLERYVDEITLEDIAKRAEVAVQTVLRRFGTRDALIGTVADELNRVVGHRRDEARVGDVPNAVDRLLEEYEVWGDVALRAVAQEEREPVVRRILADGRAIHRAWIERTFAPQLARRRGAARARTIASLMAICDIHTWKTLRRDAGLDLEQTRRTMIDLLVACTNGRSA